jgi:hypothetical protein
MDRHRTATANGSRNLTIRLGLSQLARLALLSITILFPFSVRAQTYDAAIDFSSINNPTGVWSYGTKPVSNLGTGTYTLYSDVSNYGPDIRLWATTPSISAPWLSKNTSGSTVSDGPTNWFGGQLLAHAGSGTASVLRFTAPVTQTYNFSATASNQSLSFSGTLFFIYVNSSFYYGSSLGSYGDTIGTTNLLPITLNAGETFEFMVVPRIDNSFNSTSTGLDVQVSFAAVPEPASLALIGLSVFGSGGVFWYRRRLQQRQAQQSIDFS